MRFKSGMISYAGAYLAGVLLLQQFPYLPTLSAWLLSTFFFVLLFCVLPVLGINNRHKWYGFYLENKLVITHILLIYMGYSLSLVFAHQQLTYRLDEALAGHDLEVTGTVADIPVDTRHGQRFEFDIVSVKMPAMDQVSGLAEASLPQRVRISWYKGERVMTGETWQLLLRLKPPHGFQNPGGFDYEAWLFQKGIHATGYVRQSDRNRLLPFKSASAMVWINQLRQSLRDQIDSYLAPQNDRFRSGSASMIKALAIGDKSSISNGQWQVLAATGTTHLMAISGLHIGLVSLFAYLLIRRLIPVSFIDRLPAQHIALTIGCLLSILYSALAGFSIPTQRACIMLTVIVLMTLLRRYHRPSDVLGLALIVVLMYDPSAVLSIGFWFSFSAVAVIYMSVAGQYEQASTADTDVESIRTQSPDQPLKRLYLRSLEVLKQWTRLQLMISVFLLPLSLYMFQQASLVSPLANLVLIPYISLIIVPLVLIAMVLASVSVVVSNWVFALSAIALDAIWPLLEYLSEFRYATLVHGDVTVFNLLASTAGLLILYHSRQLATAVLNRYLDHRRWETVRYSSILMSILLITPLFINTRQSLPHGEFRLSVLDVGQGSAAVIQTEAHVLIFDSGDRFSERFDAGSSVVLPYLRHEGIDKVDRLIISHGDADHIGGAAAILDALPGIKVIGQDIADLGTDDKEYCRRGMSWHWDGVHFEMLSPDVPTSSTDSRRGYRNNHSCVMKVSSSAGSVMFTGDIEQQAEQELISIYGQKLASDALVVPHHGSKTSSSQSFIDSVDADYALFSVGYRNRYRLPNSTVMSRYRSASAQVYRTDRDGAITVDFTHHDGIDIDTYRQSSHRYWYHL